MDRIEYLLDEIEASYGLDIQWKFIGSGRTSCGLKEKHTYHCCEFCRKVKAGKDRLRLCSENDDVQLVQQAERERKPFIATCHAGVSELAVPFFGREGRWEVFLAGIFRKPDSSCPYGALRQEFEHVPFLDEDELERLGRLLEALSVILRDRRDSVHRENGEQKEIQDPRISRAVEYIGRNFAGTLRMKNLASKYSLSESRFMHLFRKETGLSVVTYITRCRLKAARQMLELVGTSIQDVMDQCGFYDQSRFGKLFKEYTGYSPLAYHKKFRCRKDV